jgi:hypothetical protein
MTLALNIGHAIFVAVWLFYGIAYSEWLYGILPGSVAMTIWLFIYMAVNS